MIQFVDFSGREADREGAINKLVSACRGDAEEIQLVQTAPAPKPRNLSGAARLRSFVIRPKVLAAVLAIALAGIVWYVLGTKAEERRRMNSAALSPNGSYLAAATGQGLGVGIARVWDVNSGRQLARFTTKEGPFWVVAWSPKGNSLAIGDHEGRIRTYDAETWKLSHELEGPRSYIQFIAWSPDGSALATGDDTGTVWAWDAANGNPCSISRRIRRILTRQRGRPMVDDSLLPVGTTPSRLWMAEVGICLPDFRAIPVM